MSAPIAVSARAANDVRSLVEQSQRLQDTLRTYVEALGAALDVPAGWRFDTQQMEFVPPPEQPPTDPE
jgi:Fe-S cluster assembly iron-binding protein IscA